MSEMTRRGQMTRDDSNAPVGFNYKFIPSTATSANVANKPGILHSVWLNGPYVSGTITIYDGTSSSGATIANITPNTWPDSFPVDITFSTGLYITLSSASVGNVTVSYISADK